MSKLIEPCALLNPAGRCTALNYKHRNCPTTNCPFYVTAERRAESEAAARQRCERLGIPYGEEYAKLAEGRI